MNRRTFARRLVAALGALAAAPAVALRGCGTTEPVAVEGASVGMVGFVDSLPAVSSIDGFIPSYHGFSPDSVVAYIDSSHPMAPRGTFETVADGDYIVFANDP